MSASIGSASKYMRVRKHRAPNGALRQFHRFVGGVFRQPRKHRAPKGALRQRVFPTRSDAHDLGQKAPSAKRRIKTTPPLRRRCIPPTQKAPSAKRCIKTVCCRSGRARSPVRKYRAPKGALRRLARVSTCVVFGVVRKHRAP